MTSETEPQGPAADKPRIALMGEFSAGKSTLANLLLEQDCSPVKVTATQLPPIWYSFGDERATRVSNAGTYEQIALDEHMIENAEDTQLIFVDLSADILDSIDLIDMPGTSDPNLPEQYWKTILPLVDLVIWCTPANQAWRQSEAALWEEVDPDLRARSLLLITRYDQVRSEIDRARILKRVRMEAGDVFGAVLPVSLTEAQAAPSNEDVLESSGVSEMIRYLIGALEGLGSHQRPAYVPRVARDQVQADEGDGADQDAEQTQDAAPEKAAGRVIPRRVIRKPRTVRPSPVAS